MSKKSLTTIVNSEGVSAEEMKPTFEGYMQKVKQNHPDWSDDRLAESAQEWEARNGFALGTFTMPELKEAVDPAPEEFEAKEIPIEHDEEPAVELKAEKPKAAKK